MADFAANRAKRERSRSVAKSFTTSGVRQTLYTCPPNCMSRMVLLFVANANGNVTLNVEWYTVHENEHYYIIGGKNMNTGDYIQLSDSYLVLEPGDKIELTITGGTVLVDGICTVEETFIPNG